MWYIAAENFELLGNLLTQLSWLLSNVVYGDANGLLAHYKDNKRKVPQNVRISKRNILYNCSERINVLGISYGLVSTKQLHTHEPIKVQMYMFSDRNA